MPAHDNRVERFAALVEAKAAAAALEQVEQNHSEQPLDMVATPPAAPVQEPVACAVCNEVHAILDADESKIIRDAKDGYPDGRTPRTLTLQERITALCVYASDWKRWCLEKENTTPPAAQRQWTGLMDEEISDLAINNAPMVHEFARAVEAKLREENGEQA